MALTGIEGFKNVYDILEAVSVGDKFRLRRAARKIRLVLMCADSSTLNEEDRAALVAILGLLVTDWNEAEVCCPQLSFSQQGLIPSTGPSPGGSSGIPSCTRQGRNLLRCCRWTCREQDTPLLARRAHRQAEEIHGSWQTFEEHPSPQ